MGLPSLKRSGKIEGQKFLPANDTSADHEMEEDPRAGTGEICIAYWRPLVGRIHDGFDVSNPILDEPREFRSFPQYGNQLSNLLDWRHDFWNLDMGDV